MTDLNFDTMHDEEIVKLAQADRDGPATEYLLNKYKNFVRSKARSYYLIGGDHEDIVQEGMIGLYKAIRDYCEDKLCSFYGFADICISRQIITAIKSATRQKHIPLNSSISLNHPLYQEDSDRTLMDTIEEDQNDNPENVLINREDMRLIESHIGSMLSKLEHEVLLRYVEGKSYMQIAEELGRHAKCVDNALQRIKRKLVNYADKH